MEDFFYISRAASQAFQAVGISRSLAHIFSLKCSRTKIHRTSSAPPPYRYLLSFCLFVFSDASLSRLKVARIVY